MNQRQLNPTNEQNITKRQLFSRKLLKQLFDHIKNERDIPRLFEDLDTQSYSRNKKNALLHRIMAFERLMHKCSKSNKILFNYEFFKQVDFTPSNPAGLSHEILSWIDTCLQDEIEGSAILDILDYLGVKLTGVVYNGYEDDDNNYGDMRLMQSILQNKNNTSHSGIDSGYRNFLDCIEEGHIRDIKLFLGICKTIDDYNSLEEGCNESGIFLATRIGHIDVCRLLFQSSFCAVNDQDSFGQTPLHIAIKYNQMKTVHYLLNYGADIFKGDKSGNMPLHYSVRSGSLEMTNYLITFIIKRIRNILRGTVSITQDKQPLLTLKRVTELFNQMKSRLNKQNDIDCFRKTWCFAAALDIYKEVNLEYQALIFKPTKVFVEFCLENLDPDPSLGCITVKREIGRASCRERVC